MPPSSTTAPILLHGYILNELTTATDLSGNVIWYYHRPVGALTRWEEGGRMFIYNSHSTNLYNNVVEEIDLAGNITLQTNANRINEQLALMTGPNGLPRRPITQFDHEIRRLSNGDIVVKASSEMVVYNNAKQCGSQSYMGMANSCDVLGMQVLVLDPNLQIIWAWDAFDFLNISRRANLHEKCVQGQGGCPVFFLDTIANDWVHGNSIQLTADGNFLLSLRHQDWVIKINYANGTGDGSVIWVMGYDDNSPLAPTGANFFTMNNPPSPPAGSTCTTPVQLQEYAWFSHQHDANFQPFDLNGQEVFTILDNGNLRIAKCDTNGDSRGYVLNVDETNMTVIPLLAQDLGYYSTGLGTAEVIPGTSNYHFELGQTRRLPTVSSESMEVTPQGITAFEMNETNVQTYRSYRMQDMYTPPAPM